MRWLLLYSIVWCLGLDGRDICLQHLVSGSGSLQLQDAENLSLCSYHEFFKQVFCWLSCGTDTSSVLTSGRWSDLWLRVVIRDCKWEICWEVEGKISLCNVKWVKLFCQSKHWYSKSDGFGDVLCAGSSGEWVTSTSSPQMSCIVRPFASLVGLCQRLYLWNSWVLTLDSQAPCLKFLGVTELCTSCTQNKYIRHVQHGNATPMKALATLMTLSNDIVQSWFGQKLS
jgi:hypothetical protein